MKTLNAILALFISITVLSLTSCGESDEPDIKDDATLGKDIIGTWYGEWSKQTEGMNLGGTCTITFEEKGDYNARWEINAPGGRVAFTWKDKFQIKDGILNYEYKMLLNDDTLTLTYLGTSHSMTQPYWSSVEITVNGEKSYYSPESLTFRRIN